MTKVKLFLTFDYELPLGGVAQSYKHSLFEPTNRLLDLAQELKVPLVFFADIICATRFKEWDKEGFYNPFVSQLHQALGSGHDVQLHLHPHWLLTKWENGSFLPSEKFTLGSFVHEPYPFNIEGIIDNSCKELKLICREVLPNYNCTAYRAGGYALQPHTEIILKTLKNNGILYDSSISRGYFFKSDVSLVDYRKLPDKANWFLSETGDFSKEASDGILEIPIASKPKNLFELPTRLKLHAYKSREVENRGRPIHSYKKIPLKDTMKQWFASRMLTVDNHTYSLSYLMDILNYHIKKHKNHETVLCSLIGHPKAMGDYALELLKDFVIKIREQYGEAVEFSSFSQLNDEQQNK